MKLELTRIEPLRCANVLAAVYAALFIILVLIFAPIVALFSAFIPMDEAGAEMPPLIVFVILYPVLGAVIGWIGGLLMAVLYNLVVRWTGGLLVALEGHPTEAEG